METLYSAAATAVAWAPSLVLIGALVLTFVAGGLLFLMRMTRQQDAAHPARPVSAVEPMVSIHLPICSEPPDVVATTLRSLARLDYSRYEVIVLDNNTSDPAFWKPVEALCENLGSRFRFYHVEFVKGHKAGALNLCLKLTDPNAVYVMSLDADYQVEPDVLCKGLGCFTAPDISHVQLPQAYRGIGRSTAPLALMFERYFRHFASDASATGSMLLTGTLSLIRIEALRKVDGWPLGSLTEDAALGVRLLQAGYRGLYSPTIGGRGLLPLCAASLLQQRRRWAAGNAQVLRGMLRRGQLRSLLSPTGLSMLAQLSAWIDMRLLSGLLVILGGVLALAGISSTSMEAVLTTASLVLIAMTALHFVEWFWVARRLGNGCTDSLAMLRMQESLSFASMIGSLDLLSRSRLGFVRTPKTLVPFAYRKPDAVQIWSVGAGLALVSFIITAAWLPAFAAALLLLPALFRLEAAWRLDGYAKRMTPPSSAWPKAGYDLPHRRFSRRIEEKPI